MMLGAVEKLTFRELSNMDIAAPVNRVEQREYWDTFYSRPGIAGAMWPSQFAAFVFGEIDRQADLIDIGCGTGRDALFFATQGLNVIGVDSSEAAIGVCRSIQREWGLKSVNFLHASIDDPDLLDQVLLYRAGGSPIIYARFFLHAITEEQEDTFLKFADAVCVKGGTLAAEFRTVRDAAQTKVTPPHYRRFMEPMALLERTHRHGFLTRYYVEGFGFAKYGTDDAYVARCLLSRPAV